MYFERGAETDVHDLDVVGLTVQARDDGTWLVVGVVERDGRPAAEGVAPGDALLQIDGLPVTGASMGTVVDALRGAPGEMRALVLERNRTRVSVRARVQRCL